MPTPSVTRMSDRRRFLKLVGMAGLSSTLAGPALALAQSSSSGKAKLKTKSKPAVKPKPASPPAAEPPEISEDARALAGVIKRRYGAHLTDAQLEDIAKELTWRLRSGESLRKLQLTNGDEPDFIFKA